MCPTLRRGESVAVDGCCLTVESRTNRTFTAFGSPETLSRTTLGGKSPGAPVNLERALSIGDRLGGHLVSGHVDGIGRVVSIRSAGGRSWEYCFEIPEALAGEVVSKGSIAIDGVSLTVARLEETRVTVAVIPETYRRTTLSRKREGDAVNVETDLIGKYVFRQLAGMGMAPARGGGLTLDRLREAGF